MTLILITFLTLSPRLWASLTSLCSQICEAEECYLRAFEFATPSAWPGSGLVAVSDSCELIVRSPPGSSVHRIFQARILEWVAISFSRGSSWRRDQTRLPCTAGRFFTNWATREALAWSPLIYEHNLLPQVFYLSVTLSGRAFLLPCPHSFIILLFHFTLPPLAHILVQ